MFWKKSLVFFLLTFFLIPFKAFAYSDYVIAGGENIGIELNSKNIMVVGLYDINGEKTAAKSGVKIGDLITKVEDIEVNSIKEMVDIISKSNSDKITLEIKRDDKAKQIEIPLYKDSNNVYKTGLYVKDNISGIGTLSFVDPNTKLFGALGHEVIESSTNQILEIKDGKIYDSTVTSIDRSQNGVAGEKNAVLDYDKVNGDISKNTTKGIFGTYTRTIRNNNLYKVAHDKDITKGKATILTVLDGNKVESFDIDIIKIDNDKNEIKNIVFEITDQKLLNKTGGIVQGMSGSPIIQDDKIIGAVTHVVVDNPIKGYGIFITKMLEEAEN